MGGLGSGRFKGKQTKDLTSQYPAVDIRRWKGSQLNQKGSLFRYEWILKQDEISSVLISVSLDHIIISDCRFMDTDIWNGQSFRIDISWTPCHFGGARPWFICPAPGCGKRVGVLYLGDICACRECQKLTYRSQRQTEYQRTIKKTHHLRKRLGWSSDLLEPNGFKPKGMHWTTFRQIESKHNALLISALEYWSMRLSTVCWHLEAAIIQTKMREVIDTT